MYYRELEPGSKHVGTDTTLVETEAPEDFVVERGHYEGPSVNVDI